MGRAPGPRAAGSLDGSVCWDHRPASPYQIRNFVHPAFWRNRYNLVKGATHGLSHNLAQLGYFRPHNRHPVYRNLFFTGASTHPGTGMPTALISGRLAAARMIDEL
jgi:phytoene dehydrogenase-like protein